MAQATVKVQGITFQTITLSGDGSYNFTEIMQAVNTAIAENRLTVNASQPIGVSVQPIA
jgi:hypothetical protein